MIYDAMSSLLSPFFYFFIRAIGIMVFENMTDILIISILFLQWYLGT